MKTLYLNAVSHRIIGTLAREGWLLEPGDRILDIGCGAGGLVVRLRELGYEAYGFDIAPYWKNLPAEQHEWFRSLLPEAPSPYSDITAPYHLPFADENFDAVISTHVLEHIKDLDPVYAETARVLRQDGIMVNLFPSASCLIECHTYVPFYNLFPKKWTILLAAALGIRNEFQNQFSIKETAHINTFYFTKGVHLRSNKTVYGDALKHFDKVQDIAPTYYCDRPKGWALFRSYIKQALKDEIFMRGLAFNQRMSVFLCTKKKKALRNS